MKIGKQFCDSWKVAKTVNVFQPKTLIERSAVIHNLVSTP